MWLSPSGSQHNVFLSEYEKQDSTQIEVSYPYGATIRNQAPEGEISTMVVVKWSDAAEEPIVKLNSPLCV